MGTIGPNAANISGGWGPDERASHRGDGQMFRRREEFPARHRRVLEVAPPLSGKDAFHGRCMYPTDSLKPTDDVGDLEKTNLSEKAKRPKHPKQHLSR